MVQTIPSELAGAIETLRKEVAALSERLSALESRIAPPAPAAVPSPVAAAAPPQPGRAPGITEEELLAISGALAAYLGVRVHIRQIRLIASRAWAQEGRVSIQASHRLHS
jgi:methylmalonyl-CoA carboxyltransferase large subunit